jgi:L-2-hydroxyglutarate oxidase LhgO
MADGADAAIDALVVGAGVIGLACARALAEAGQEVVVVEAAEAIGTATSSRNSEVIHAGLYYPAGSAKARLCVRGRQRLYAYCDERGIAHRRSGKLVVATDDGERAALEALQTKALANGVPEVELIDGAQARRLEPALCAVAALHSTSTGIVDSHAFMLALQGDAERAGAAFAFRAPFVRARAGARGFEIDVGGAEPIRLAARRLVNAAGLRASVVALAVEGLDPQTVPRTRLCKGNYFALAGRAPFARLVYPVPHKDGLGVHYTLDLGGQGRFGPDVQWLDGDAGGAEPDYAVDPARGDAFYAAIRRYWPALPDGALLPAYSGMRPKIHAPHEPAVDFLLQGQDQHGLPGLVNLLGIESPGLTAALAIAEEVAAMLA